MVKQFVLRDEVLGSNEDPLIRLEKQRRLHGAVSMAERRDRLGQYYTMIWNHPAGAGQGEVEIRFEFQQGATASLIKRMEASFAAGEGSGVAEFAVIGDDYFEQGRVLAWKATLLRGGRVVATEQSYLWQ